MVISSASPKTDSQRAMDLLASITDKDALQKTLADLDARTKAAETAEAKARNAKADADAALSTLQAKEKELQEREASLAQDTAAFKTVRTQFNDHNQKEQDRLTALANDLNTKTAQQDAEHAAKAASLTNSFAQREDDLKNRTAQVENLAKGLGAREKAVADREAKADALVAEYRDKIAALKGIVNG